MIVEACASNYVTESGTIPACTNTLWSETYDLPTPYVGVPPWSDPRVEISLSLDFFDSSPYATPSASGS